MDTYDVIVVGAGPAGLMAAGQASAGGARTLLLEKMNQAGLKLCITGKGRANVTNIAPLEEFLERYGPKGRFLRQAYNRFFAPELIDFLEDQSVTTKTERGGRVFTTSGRASDVRDALLLWTKAQGAEVRTRLPVDQLILDAGRVTGVKVAGGQSIHAPAVIIATGGASYPGTGSTGDGYRLAESAGHRIVHVRPALVPIETIGPIAPRLQGLSLHNVQLSVLVGERRLDTAFGEMLFTHYGVSGPIVLSLSRTIVDALQEGRIVSLSIDLKPALDEEQLDTRLLRDLDAQGKRGMLALLSGMLPQKLVSVCLDLTGIPGDRRAHQLTSGERRRLRKWLKDFRLGINSHRSFAEAVVTAGGVDLGEVDPRTMASRLVSGLYFAGEVMDIDGDTGGFNLQAAFSTGWLSGSAAAQAMVT